MIFGLGISLFFCPNPAPAEPSSAIRSIVRDFALEMKVGFETRIFLEITTVIAAKKMRAEIDTRIAVSLFFVIEAVFKLTTAEIK
jgi:hypothetical protein